jgi:hypothetical protein
MICCEKTHTIQWDKLGEKLLAYNMFVISLCRNSYGKNQEIDIRLCRHCLVKNLL